LLQDLPSKIRDGKASVAVIGLGRVGLPLALAFARSGLRVVGVDVDAQRVSAVNKGDMPFFYPEVQRWLKEALAKGAFAASTPSKETIEHSDVIVITVGTPTGQQYQLDYSQVYSALKEVASADLKDRAIIMRSTAVPSTMTTIVIPLLVKESKLRLGVDFAVAMCPERILEGQAHRELYELPEIVGASDSLSAEIASQLFRKLSPSKKILITTLTGAELAKLFTNIYRYVNFALSNEFAIWAERYGEDAHEIIRVANENYPRSNIPRPGFAGGPCLGKDGFLLDSGTTFSSVVSTAWKLNEAVPQHVVMTLIKSLGSLYAKRVTVLGLAFKANSDDTRLSPAVKLVDTLKAYGADVRVHDPHIEETESLREVLRNPEVVILATNHDSFRNIATDIDESGCEFVYDVWGVYDPGAFKRAKYMRFGKAA